MGCLLRKAWLTLSLSKTVFGSSTISTLKSMEGSPELFLLGMTVVSPEIAQKLLSTPSSFRQEKRMETTKED